MTNNKVDISKTIKELMENNNLEEAYNIACQSKYKYDPNIQTQKMKILAKLGKINEALDVAKRSELKNVNSIVKQKEIIESNYVIPKILDNIDNGSYKLDDIDRKDINEWKKNILKIAWYDKNNKTEGMEFISSIIDNYSNEGKTYLLNYLKNRMYSSVPYDIKLFRNVVNKSNDELLEMKSKREERRSNFASKRELSYALTAIYLGEISLTKLNNLDLTTYEKDVLSLAWYDKFNKKLGYSYVKEIMSKYNDHKKSVFNAIKSKIENKRELFNIEFYCGILNATVDQNYLLKRAKEEEKEHNKKAINININRDLKPVFVNNTNIVKKGGYVARIDTENNKKNTEKKVVVAPKKEKKEKEINTNLTIDTLFKKEVLEIATYLYSLTANGGKDAILALDNFYTLVSKKASDVNALNKFKRIVKVFNNKKEEKILEKSL